MKKYIAFLTAVILVIALLPLTAGMEGECSCGLSDGTHEPSCPLAAQTQLPATPTDALPEEEAEVITAEGVIAPSGDTRNMGDPRLRFAAVASSWGAGATSFRDQISEEPLARQIYDTLAGDVTPDPANDHMFSITRSSFTAPDPDDTSLLYDSEARTYYAYFTEQNPTHDQVIEAFAGVAEDLQLAIDAYRFDHPEFFYSTGIGYQMNVDLPETQPDGTYRRELMSLTVVYYVEDNAAVRASELSTALAAFKTAHPMTGANEFEIVETIHDYIVENCEYNYAAIATGGYETYSDAYNAHGALVGNSKGHGNVARGSVVCEGYSEAFALLCRQYGLTAILVVGRAGGGNHMWNYVCINGLWYGIDTTWDDPGAPNVDDTYLLNTVTDDIITDGTHTTYGQFSVGGHEFFFPTLCSATTQVTLTLPAGYSGTAVYVDGVEVTGVAGSGGVTVTIGGTGAQSLTMYRYNSSGRTPQGMYVWTLAYNQRTRTYAATARPDFADLLSYNGYSMRVSEPTGMRCKTGISAALRARLLSASGVYGYTLKEYGTLTLASTNYASYPMVYGGQYVSSGRSYWTENGTVKDYVFETVEGRYRFASVQTGIPVARYERSVSFRGYIVLQKGSETLTLYGPITSRSLYQLATLLRDGGSRNSFVLGIINAVER